WALECKLKRRGFLKNDTNSKLNGLLFAAIGYYYTGLCNGTN
ncbi:20383_t:CDS:2, partial [Rhizophagus irregularis]